MKRSAASSDPHAPRRPAPRPRAAAPGTDEEALARLRRIEGQVRGVQRMVQEQRYCVDVLMQISAIQESLRGVGTRLLRAHLEHCVAAAATSGDPHRARTVGEELADLFGKYGR
jgi:DNA-binding FrmR family transcriptional regulator